MTIMEKTSAEDLLNFMATSVISVYYGERSCGRSGWSVQIMSGKEFSAKTIRAALRRALAATMI